MSIGELGQHFTSDVFGCQQNFRLQIRMFITIQLHASQLGQSNTQPGEVSQRITS
jgi:hypothetical protein